MDDLAALSIPDLLNLYAKTIVQLRERGVCRSSNNPVADYTEWLVSSRLRLQLANKSTPGFDALDSTGTRYQIKARRQTPQNPSTQLGQLRGLDDDPFDVLAGVIYNPDFSIAYAALVPIALVRERATFRARTNAYVFHLRPALLTEPGVIDITHRLTT